MRTFVTVICSLALVCAAGAQPPPEKKGQGKKKGAPAGQVSQTHGKAVGKSAQVGKATGGGKPTTKTKPATTGKPMEAGKPIGAGKPKEKGKPAEIGKPPQVGKAKTTRNAGEIGKPTKGQKLAATGKPAKPLKPQHFNLSKRPNTAKAPPVKFQQGRRIEGSQNWHGQQYAAFRNYQDRKSTRLNSSH